MVLLEPFSELVDVMRATVVRMKVFASCCRFSRLVNRMSYTRLQF